MLFSDGVDTASEKITKVKTQSIAKQTWSPIYAIYFNTHQDAQARQYLADLAVNSGGMIIDTGRVEDLRPAFNAVAGELTSQYSLGYYPTNNVRDGTYRKIEIRVRKSDLFARTRKGYWHF